jgi:hypothetical protein
VNQRLSRRGAPSAWRSLGGDIIVSFFETRTRTRPWAILHLQVVDLGILAKECKAVL